MAVRRKVPDGSSLIVDLNSDSIVGSDSVLTDDRPWEVWYSRYGKPIRLPADAAQSQLLRMQGYSQNRPRKPRKAPTSIKMRDGSIFELAATAGNVSQAEKLRMDGGGSVTAASAPTATYYSAMGDVLPNLPADPASMKQYLELGLSLTPPPVKKVKASLTEHLELGPHLLANEA